MATGPSGDFLRQRLLGGADFEVSGVDQATRAGYRLTVRHGDIDLAPFSRIAPEALRSAVENCLPLSIGATLYRVEPSFGRAVLGAVREAARVRGISATVQDQHQIVCLLGQDPAGAADALAALLPAGLEWDEDSLIEGSRDWGRKVGHAAKDLAGLRGAALGVEQLQTLEQSGGEEAHEAVTKAAVWPAPTLEALRAQGVPPAVAFGTVSCWRMLKQRPENGPDARLAFVRGLPSLRASLEACRTLDEFVSAVASFLRGMGRLAPRVVGPRLPSFSRRANSSLRTVSSHRDAALRGLLAIEALPDADARWAYAAAAVAGKAEAHAPAGIPLPDRPALPLDGLTRSGEGLPEAPARQRIPEELGITGLEIGNYVSRPESERLVRYLAEALTDLKQVLGPWAVTVCRRGNLSVALGARGKGKHCAHYEPALRVINLTKSRGDGTLAHEFGHFLDHMLAEHGPPGDSRYLSARVARAGPQGHPIAEAMRRVMRAINLSPRRERVTGLVEPRRWFLTGWIRARGYDQAIPPQQAFDRVADTVPAVFRGGRRPRDNSVALVNTLARLAKAPVEVEIAFDDRSDYVSQARQLGAYWYRPEELFARAFESFVEDELERRGWRSEYLVTGTRRDYARCRGLPYPTGDERRRINEGLRGLLALGGEGAPPTA